MNITRKFLQITGFIVLLCASNALFAVPIFISNDSSFAIIFRKAPAFATGSNIPEYQLNPGQMAEIDTDTLCSLRRGGIGSEYVSSYYNIPAKELLTDSVLNNTIIHNQHRKAGDNPVIRIYSGIPYGWSFKLDWTKTKTVK